MLHDFIVVIIHCVLITSYFLTVIYDLPYGQTLDNLMTRVLLFRIIKNCDVILEKYDSYAIACLSGLFKCHYEVDFECKPDAKWLFLESFYDYILFV